MGEQACQGGRPGGSELLRMGWGSSMVENWPDILRTLNLKAGHILPPDSPIFLLRQHLSLAQVGFEFSILPQSHKCWTYSVYRSAGGSGTGIKPKASCIQGNHYNIELHVSPFYLR